MASVKRGKYYFGESQADLRKEIARYSKANYVAKHFADAVCQCGSHVFRLLLDDNEGAAVRKCVTCSVDHPIGDSAEYVGNAKLEECACPCASEEFEITVGVSLYEGSDDVKWFYLGCRCPKCALIAVYGDWKNEFEDYRALLARV
jgi:hypothetical protein